MRNTKVLVVEDEIIVARDIQNKLKKLRYVVPTIVLSGEEAIKKAEDDHPDLVLMDIKLEAEMDGVEAAEQIYTRFNIPVVYLTAYADENTFQRAKTTEPFGYILKPFEGRELRTTIELALYKHRMESKLKSSAQQFAATLKSMGDAMVVTDINTLVTFMNAVAEVLTGWKQKDALGKKLKEIFNITDKETGTVTENPVAKILRQGTVMDLPDRSLLIVRHGRKIPIGGSAAPIRNDEGSITGVVLVFRDATQHRPAEKVMRASAEKYRLTVESGRIRGKMPVILTEEEIRELKRQPQFEERYYLKELKKRQREGSKRLKRIENKIFNAKRNSAIILLFYSSGIRVAELLNLNLADIDLKKRQIKMATKNDHERCSFFTGKTVKALDVYIEARRARCNAQDEALFITRIGERVKGRDVHRVVYRYTKEAGINKKVSPHTLRHSVAIHLLDRGMDLLDVQAFLRHASISSTRIYTHEVSNERLKEKLSICHPDNL